MNLTIDKTELPKQLNPEDKWILSKYNTLVADVTANMVSEE
jgi:valyl-tRNA synthetase